MSTWKHGEAPPTLPPRWPRLDGRALPPATALAIEEWQGRPVDAPAPPAPDESETPNEEG